MQTCDRECLRGTITKYLDAAAAHDPKALPLGRPTRFTEDTVEKPLGERLWKTAGSLGTFRQDILDVRQSVAGTHVVMQENGVDALVQARLKSSRGKSLRSIQRSYGPWTKNKASCGCG